MRDRDPLYANIPDGGRSKQTVEREPTDHGKVHAELDKALHEARTRTVEGYDLKLDLAGSRIIIFSDQHKGDRSKSDDFRRSERAYNAALAYYEKLGYTLIVLGDAEELWKSKAKKVLASYARTFDLEARFHEDGRYFRIWGNHDDDWAEGQRVEALLHGKFPGLEVRESLLLRIEGEGGSHCGDLFLVHGHQGSLTSDRYKLVSRFLVRNFYRPFQRLTGFSHNTPATDWTQREGHNEAMYQWAKGQPGAFVLVAGHTHDPIFEAKIHAAQIVDKLEEAEARVRKDPNNRVLQMEYASHRAHLEWVLAQQERHPNRGRILEFDKPCYFNSGCCCYSDGDITGLEIADGQIRLVRWPDHKGNPNPGELAAAHLAQVFNSCKVPPKAS